MTADGWHTHPNPIGDGLVIFGVFKCQTLLDLGWTGPSWRSDQCMILSSVIRHHNHGISSSSGSLTLGKQCLMFCFCFSGTSVQGVTVWFVEINLMCQSEDPSECQEDPDSCSGSAQNISGYLYSTAHQCNPVSGLNYTLQCEVKCICRLISENVSALF